MRVNSKPVSYLEAVLLPVLAFVINLFFPGDPGFASLHFLPYIAPALFMAVYEGLGIGFLSFGVGTVLIYLGFPLERYLFNGEPINAVYWASLLKRSVVPFPTAIVLLYSFGLIRRFYTRSLTALKDRFRRAIKLQHTSRKKSRALEKVNVELDERLSRQQESITSLYNQLKRIDTLSVSNTINTLLETVRLFTRTTKASVWQYWPTNHSMKLAAQIGWKAEEKQDTEIPVEGTLEGWVYRNNQLFSVRMLLQYENLRKMDRSGNIIIMPINIKKKSWGILSIEDLPFEKYNLYTERVLYIIISLLEPALERSIEYETFVEKEERDSETGLPLFSSFYRFLEEEMKRMEIQRGTLCIVILEIANYSDLTAGYGEKEAAGILHQLVPVIEELTGNFAEIFHYKNRNQLGIVVPNLDYDGASLFCLEVLERINTGGFKAGDIAVNIEALVGYSTYSGTQTQDEMLSNAERLLEIQKL